MLAYKHGKQKAKNQKDTAVIDAVVAAAVNEVADKEAVEKLNKDFSIEHYPLTKKYYPKYKDYYLYKNNSTGIIEKSEAYLFAYANNFQTEKEAREFIDLAKEQLFKTNVIRIAV